MSLLILYTEGSVSRRRTTCTEEDCVARSQNEKYSIDLPRLSSELGGALWLCWHSATGIQRPLIVHKAQNGSTHGNRPEAHLNHNQTSDRSTNRCCQKVEQLSLYKVTDEFVCVLVCIKPSDDLGKRHCCALCKSVLKSEPAQLCYLGYTPLYSIWERRKVKHYPTRVLCAFSLRICS